MPQSRSRLRSELSNIGELKLILTKIALLYSQNHHRVVFETDAPNGSTQDSGFDRFNAADCTSVSFAPNSSTNTINFKRPGGSVVEHYDYTDIQIIRRLRTKKWLIRILGSADPA